MALATQCPYCHTTFRVAQDQLKLRAGLVRCGACKEVFNGVEHLLRPEGSTQAKTHLLPQSEAPSPAEMPINANPDTASSGQETELDEPIPVPSSINEEEFSDFSEFLKPVKADTATAFSSSEVSESRIHRNEEDPLQPMTLMDLTSQEKEENNHIAEQSDMPVAKLHENGAAEENESRQPDPVSQAIKDLERKPHRYLPSHSDYMNGNALNPGDSEGTEEPDFVKRGRRKERSRQFMTIAMTIGSCFLLAALLLQGVYAFRNQIAAWLPQTRPMLEHGCAIFGCRINLPTQIDAVSLESSELQMPADKKNVLILTALLRNHGRIVQAWPNMELTLNDTRESQLLRRVFVPREYLPATQDPTKGFAPSSEQTIKMVFEIAQLKPAGYRVYLFYP